MAGIVEASLPVNEPLEKVRVAFDSTAKTILQWDLSVREFIFDRRHRCAINQYMQALDEIQRLIESSTEFNEAESVMVVAKARLKHEFKNILKGGSGPRYSTCSSFSSDSCSSEIHYEDDCIDYDALSVKDIGDLRSIAERMNTAGYLTEFVEVYKSERKLNMDVHFQRFGVENLSVRDVRSSAWELLGKKIKLWIKAAKFCFRLFARERILCEDVFGGLLTPETSYMCFIAVAKDLIIHLLNFAEAISTLPPSPVRLFKVLDLHETLSDVLPHLQNLRGTNQSESIRVEAVVQVLGRFKELVRQILSKFEDDLICDRLTINDTLTIKVMKYITQISVHEHTLVELIIAKPTTKTESSNLNILGTKLMDMDRTPFALHLMWIIGILRYQLETKSNEYENVALAHLFMMNNLCYIVQQIRGCPQLMNIIGYDYINELTRKFGEVKKSYITSTWSRVHDNLRVNGSYKLSKSVLRDRFKSFNNIFDEVHKTQATWMVSNKQLREELHISISDKLIPAYRSFVDHFGVLTMNGTHSKNYIKYSVEDIQIRVLDLFGGYPTSKQ